MSYKKYKKTAINIHHTAAYAENDIAEQFSHVNNSHYNRWNGQTKSSMGFYGGYHYLIERSGVVQQFREEDEVGAHNNLGIKWVGASRQSLNHYGIGISFAGNMSRQHLTEAQIISFVELVKDIQTRHDIKDEDITPHRDWKATQCPGNNIPDKVYPWLLEQYEKIKGHIEDPEIVKWAKENKIITKWSLPYNEHDIKQAYIAYKICYMSMTKAKRAKVCTIEAINLEMEN